MAISPDGKLVACHRGGPPHVVQLWDWSAGKQVAELQGFAGHLYRMAFSPDGKLLATGDEFGTIRLFDVATNKEVASLKGHGGAIRALSSRPTGVGCTRQDSTVRSGAGSPFPIRTRIRSTEMSIFFQ